MIVSSYKTMVLQSKYLFSRPNATLQKSLSLPDEEMLLQMFGFIRLFRVKIGGFFSNSTIHVYRQPSNRPVRIVLLTTLIFTGIYVWQQQSHLSHYNNSLCFSGVSECDG